MWTEIKRKLFHLLGLLYVVGIIFIPRQPYLIILFAGLLVVGALETLRIKNERANRFFMRMFGGFIRDGEKTKFSGLFWMLAGVCGTVALAKPPILGVAALLYLILGDSAASLVGMRVGGPSWSGSNRRLSGSAACFVMCLVVGAVILRPTYGWATVLIGAAAATLLEKGIFNWNDNLTIPIGSTLALLLSARFLT